MKSRDSLNVFNSMKKSERLEILNEKIQAACKRSGRALGDLTLVAVSKTKSAEDVADFLSLGVENFGENYLQEALPKIEAVAKLSKAAKLTNPNWHFIGQLQSNKAKLVTGNFSWIHSLDSLSSARKISQHATSLSIQQKCLIQVNVDAEATKGGVLPSDLSKFIAEVGQLSGIDLRGLMCIPDPQKHQDPRKPFQELRKLLEGCRALCANPNVFHELSMGMSHDFEAAIEEGSTFIRIGTSLFGERNK